MANTVLKPGETFDDRYVIQDDLGHGGYGHVYLVTDTSSKMQDLYALKLLKTNANAEAVRKFRNEASLLLELSADKNPHPHIVFGHVGYFHPGTNREPYILMQYAPNKTVAAALKKRAPWGLPAVEAIGYIVQAGSALQYMHDKQILHRDVKEQNMLLDARRQVLLSDFGIAIRLHQLPVTEPEGTPSYMSPEALNKLPSVYSDQFALAVTTYVLLCGRGKCPFPTETDTHYSPPIPIKNQVQQYSTLLAELEAVIQKGLAKKEEDRYPSVSKYVRALRDVLKNSDGQRSKPPISVFPNPSIPSGPHNQPLRSTIKPRPLPVPQPITPPVPKPVTPTLPVQPYSSTTPKPYRSSGCTRRTFVLGAVAAGLAVGAYELPHIGTLLKSIAGTPSTAGTPSHQLKSPTRTVATYQTGFTDIIVAWSPNGKHLAVGSYEALQVWDPLGSAKVVNFPTSDLGPNGTAIAWSPDGKYIAEDGAWIRIFDASSGSSMATFDVFTYANPIGVAWSPDGKLIATCIQEPNNSALWVGDATRRGNTGVVGYSDSPYQWQYEATGSGITWSPDGRRIAAVGYRGGDFGTAQVWDVASGKAEFVYHKLDAGDVTYGISWSPNGKYILLTDQKKLLIWNFSDGKIITSYNGHGVIVNSAAWSPDSKHVVSSDVTATVLVWNAITGNTEVVYQEHEAIVTGVDWSPLGKYIASSSDDGMVRVWTPWSG